MPWFKCKLKWSFPVGLNWACSSFSCSHSRSEVTWKSSNLRPNIKKNDTKSKCHKSDDLCKMATRNNLTIKVHSDIFISCDKKKGGKESLSWVNGKWGAILPPHFPIHPPESPKKNVVKDTRERTWQVGRRYDFVIKQSKSATSSLLSHLY